MNTTKIQTIGDIYAIAAIDFMIWRNIILSFIKNSIFYLHNINIIPNMRSMFLLAASYLFFLTGEKIKKIFYNFNHFHNKKGFRNYIKKGCLVRRELNI